MQEFIQMAMQKIGGDEQTVKKATGGVLGMIQKQASGGDFKELLTKLPGAEALMGESAGSEESSGGGGG